MQSDEDITQTSKHYFSLFMAPGAKPHLYENLSER